MSEGVSANLAVTPNIEVKTWQWKGFAIGYRQAGVEASDQPHSDRSYSDRPKAQEPDSARPALVLIHGFGAYSIHWRKNMPELAKTYRVYAIDLLGYGKSAKPAPGAPLDYTFETWGQQVLDFCEQVVGSPAFLIANSIGCVVALQAAVTGNEQRSEQMSEQMSEQGPEQGPEHILGVAMLDCSLRLLHERKRQSLPWYRSAPTPLIQSILGYKPLIRLFFAQLAKPKAVKRILRQAYGRKEAVTDELVSLLLEPAFDPGAVDVFLAFIRYSYGPIAEDLLPEVRCPVLILWGEADPWEPIALARAYADYSAVEDFIALPGIGHCPQDEAPELVNPILADWVARHCHTPNGRPPESV
jgi:pimeloyl-ACP methyl ester carboxylesterase